MSSTITVVGLSPATVAAMSPRSELLDGPKEGPNWTAIGIVILVALVVICFTFGWIWHRYQDNKNAKRIAKREQELNDQNIGLRTFFANADTDPRRVEEGRGNWQGVSVDLDEQLAATRRENDRMYAEGINPYNEASTLPATPAPSASRSTRCTPQETRYPVVPTPPAGPVQTVTNARPSRFQEHFDKYEAKYSARLASQLHRKPVPGPRNSEDIVRATLAERRGVATPSTPTPKARNFRRGRATK